MTMADYTCRPLAISEVLWSRKPFWFNVSRVTDRSTFFAL
jgi:hypothetical protein